MDNRETISMLYTLSNISSMHYPGNSLQIYIINMPTMIKNTWNLLKQSFASSLIEHTVILDH